ncbi:MAG TPA: YebC/PmpR family DNA-binding transcriptional regulator [Candidatus Portnoybacteria bacterium]|nr:YebC/PmpR family DNA-binding transcriptional regulator [Candidatus Portnoybacteria bacterium]
MSGHSKWSKIKHKKAITDVKKGKIFSKIARMISVTAREKGGDPETNSNLRLAIEKAKSVNMPRENIERAVRRGAGEGEEKLEEVTYEAYGPGGIALIIEGITDNKNRAVSEIKHILSKHNGKLAETGSVQWSFERKGVITIENKKGEEIELKLIEAGAEDIKLKDGFLEIYTKVEELEKVKNNLAKEGLTVESVSLDWLPKNPATIENPKDKEQLEKLFEALDENDDINEIYSNLAEEV